MTARTGEGFRISSDYHRRNNPLLSWNMIWILSSRFRTGCGIASRRILADGKPDQIKQDENVKKSISVKTFWRKVMAEPSNAILGSITSTPSGQSHISGVSLSILKGEVVCLLG
jgi:hypothetical protein